MPLLALCIPLQAATPLAVLVSATVALMVVVQDWRDIHLRTAAGLVLCTLPGIPIGLWLLKSAHPGRLQFGLGVLLVLFALHGWRERTRLELQSDSPVWLALCGFCAGILGGAFGMNGPALVIYGSLRRWTAQHFRATLQAYFLPASLMGLAGYWRAGLWTPAVTHNYLLSLPVVLPAVLAGRVINRRMSGKIFLRYIYAGLAVIGCVLMIRAAWVR